MDSPTRLDAQERLLWTAAAVAIAGSSLLLGLRWETTLWLFPALAVLGFGALVLYRLPASGLTALIVGFPLVAGYEAGLQAGEVAYALFAVAYFGSWFGLRLFVYREPMLQMSTDWVLGLFLLGASTSWMLSALLGGPVTIASAISEWKSLVPLAIYFPVQETIRRRQNGLHIVVGAAFTLGLFLLLRNAILFRELITQATETWQVTRGRISLNEALILAPALGALVPAIATPSRGLRWAWLAGAALFFAGLIMTQSRGFWVDYAVGVLVLVALAPWAWKRRLVLYGVFVGVSSLLLGWFLLGPVFELLWAGLLNRALSIFTSTSQDISLINRFYEARAAMELAGQNPVLGWGLGTELRANDVIRDGAYTRVFIHNGYIGLWLKTGVWGVVLMAAFWGGAIWRGVRAYRSDAPLFPRLCALASALVLFSLLPSVSTSTPFFTEDQMLLVGLLGGMAAGLSARHAAPPADSTPDAS